MYAVSIKGLDREGNEHHVDIPDFKNINTISCVIYNAIEDITGAPWFCIVDSVTIENTETSLIQTFELYTSSKEKAKIEVYSLVKGWIARDMQQLCVCEDDESDDGECGDLVSKYNELASKYNDLASKYNDLASKYNEFASFPFIITGSENDNSSKRCKLFI